MDAALTAFEGAQRDAKACGDGPARSGRTTERTVARAEAAFDRAMAGAGGVCGFTRTDAAAAAEVAEIDAMR